MSSGEQPGVPTSQSQCWGLQGLSQELGGVTKPRHRDQTYCKYLHIPHGKAAPLSHSSSSSSASSSLLLLLLLLAVSGSLCSALKTVPFTARTGKRSSRLFCDVSFNEESPL